LTTITGRRRRRARAVSASDPGTRSTREPQAANTPTNFRSPQHGTAMGHTITSRESYPQLVAEKGARSTLGDTPDGKTITTVSLASDAGGDHLRLRDAGVRRRTTPIYSHTAVSDIAALLNREGDQRRPLTLNLIIHLSKNTDLALRRDLNRHHPLSRMTTFNSQDGQSGMKVPSAAGCPGRCRLALPPCGGRWGRTRPR
jgi:hypothetical protein